MSRPGIAAIVVLLAWGADALAQESDPAYSAGRATEGEPAPATLAELESVALANNPAVAKAAAQLAAAEHRWRQVGLYPNPVAGYTADEMGDEGRAGKQGAFFGQEVVTSGKLRLNRSVAAWEVQQARTVLEAQRRRVQNDVRSGFYEVILAQRTLDLEAKLVGIGREAVRTTETLLEAKEASRIDVLQAKIEAESAVLGLHDAEARRTAAWRRLAAVLGVPAMRPPVLAGDLDEAIPDLTWDDSLARLLAESPELERARAGVQRARCQLQRECAEVVPNVDLRASVAHDNATADNIASLEVGVPIPLFNRNQGNIGRAQAEVASASAEVRRVELELQERLAGAFEQYAAARQRAERYAKEILPNAQESLRLVQAGYRQGEVGYLAMLTAQRTYFSVNLQYLASLRELWAGAVQIEGLLLEGSLRGEEREPRGAER